MTTTEAERDAVVESLVRPFDLTCAPLARAIWIATERGNYVLFDMHHIVTDGTSTGTLLGELEQLLAGEPLGPPPPLGLVACTAWESGEQASAVIAQQAAFWRARFPDGVAALGLVTDFPRPPIVDPAGDLVANELPGELRRIAARAGTPARDLDARAAARRVRRAARPARAAGRDRHRHRRGRSLAPRHARRRRHVRQHARAREHRRSEAAVRRLRGRGRAPLDRGARQSGVPVRGARRAGRRRAPRRPHAARRRDVHAAIAGGSRRACRRREAHRRRRRGPHREVRPVGRDRRARERHARSRSSTARACFARATVERYARCFERLLARSRDARRRADRAAVDPHRRRSPARRDRLEQHRPRVSRRAPRASHVRARRRTRTGQPLPRRRLHVSRGRRRGEPARAPAARARHRSRWRRRDPDHAVERADPAPSSPRSRPAARSCRSTIATRATASSTCCATARRAC